jgi:hypothetical protein
MAVNPRELENLRFQERLQERAGETLPSKEAIDFLQTWINTRAEILIWNKEALKEALEGCYAIDFAAQQHAAQVARDWQPIETAPRDGTYILLGWFLEGGGGGHPEVAFWHSTKQLWCSSRLLNAEGYYSPTHWQPLPEPPKETKP